MGICRMALRAAWKHFIVVLSGSVLSINRFLSHFPQDVTDAGAIITVPAVVRPHLTLSMHNM